MKPAPKVSVIVSCYNQREFIADAIASVLGQTYENIEAVVIDNGSTDDSAEIIRKYERDPRVTVLLHAQNGAVTKRLNEGIAKSSGEFISILYADDYYLPDKTARQMACFAKLGPEYGVVYSPGYRWNVLTGQRWLMTCFKASGYALETFIKQSQTEGFINPISPLVRRECFERYPWREDCFIEGEAIYLRMAMSYSFEYLDEPTVVMRDHLGNAGKALIRTQKQEIPLMEALVREPEFPDRLKPALRRYLAKTLMNYGWQGVRIVADPVWARECLSLATRYDPTLIVHPRTIACLALSYLPSRVRARCNSVINQLVKHRAVVAFKTDYS